MHTKRSGFTLVELIVGVGLFALLALLIVSAFTYLIGIQRTVDAKQQVLNEFRLAVDVMVKEMTSGSTFPGSCENGCPSITFMTNPRPDMPQRRIEYSYDSVNKKILKAEQKTYGKCSEIPFVAVCRQPYSTANVAVEDLVFYVGNKPVQYMQPVITIVIQGVINPGKRDEQPFNITTSVTPRLLQDPAAVPTSDNVRPSVTITSPTSATTYTTGNATIVLGGSSSDNVGVTAMRWRNTATGSSGIVSFTCTGMLCSWTSPAISLAPSTDNDITIEAQDAAGLVETDTLTVTSTMPPPPPGTPSSTNAGQNCGMANNYVFVTSSCPAGSTHLYYYRCLGTCTPTLADFKWSGAACSTFYDTGVALNGSTYTYATRAYNSSTNLFSTGMSPAFTYTTVPPWSCPPTPPPPPPQCSDTLDNDGDGKIDAADPDCHTDGNASNAATYNPNDTSEATYIPPVYQCSDGIDNDADGKIDYPTDPGCTSNTDTSEVDAPPGSFSVSATPTYLTVGVSGSAGVNSQSNKIKVYVTPTGAFTSQVNLSVNAGAITGLSPSFNPAFLNNSTNPYANGSTFYVTIPDNTTPGNYTLTLQGAAAGYPNSTRDITLVVFAVGGGQQ